MLIFVISPLHDRDSHALAFQRTDGIQNRWTPECGGEPQGLQLVLVISHACGHVNKQKKLKGNWCAGCACIQRLAAKNTSPDQQEDMAPTPCHAQ